MSISSSCPDRGCLFRRHLYAGLLVVLLGLTETATALDPSRPVSEYLRRTWSSDLNMSGGTITGIAQTPDGFMWVGTSQGLLRFDGQFFNRVEAPAGGPQLHVLSLTTDAAGALWIWLEGAQLLRYASGKFENILPLLPLEHGVTAIARTRDGDILLAALGQGIQRYSGGEFQPLATSLNSIVISLAQTSDGRIWAGTSESGLFYLGTNGSVHAVEALAATKIDCLLAADTGRMWIGTDDGIALWDGKAVSYPKSVAALRHVQILSFLTDRDGNLWIGTARGLFRLNPQGLSESALHPGDLPTAVDTLMEDREGEIWFSDARDLESLRNPLLSTVSIPGGLPRFSSGSIFVDAEGRLWLAPLSGGLYWLQNGKAHKVAQYGLGSDEVYSISGDQHGIWVGRQRGGLTHIHLNGSETRAETWTRAQGLPENNVYAAYESRDGAVWVATLPGGLTRLENGRLQTIFPSDGQAAHSVSAITEGPDETMWFATADGLIAMRGGNLRDYHRSDGLPSEDLICLAPSRQGYVWIGTDRGLAVFSGGRIRSLASGNPLLQDPIFGLALDRSGALWVITSSHVLVARSESLLKDNDPAAVRVLTEQDGLPSQQGVRRFQSVVLDRSGRVWLSLRSGISFASTGAFEGITSPVFTQIEQMLVDGHGMNTLSGIRVRSSDRRVTFRFAGLSYTAPDRVHYEYRLDGFDRQWSEPTAQREAAYTNLPPGRYIFRVRASTGGDWRGSEAVLLFRVFPRYWQTWEFEACCLGVFALVIFWAWRLRIRQVMSRANLRFEERLAERTRIAQELHDTLLQGFISASMQLHVIADSIAPQSAAKSSLTRILKLMNQVIEEGRQSLRGLRSSTIVQPALEQAFIAELQNLANPEKMTYRVIVQGATLRLRPVIRDEVLSIGREALLNVFRHAGADFVEIELRYSPGEFQLIVRDNGKGMDHHILLKGRDGHWGLSGMRSHAEAIGAKLKVLSSPGAGTEVYLRIPGTLAYEDHRGPRIMAWVRAIPFFRTKETDRERERVV